MTAGDSGPDPFKQIRADLWNNRESFALLVGAGVSRESGVPLAHEMVEKIRQDVFTLENGRTPLNIAEADDWLRCQNRFPNDYHDALGLLGPFPNSSANYIRKVVAGKVPTESHEYLANMVAAGWFQHIFTTNFDRLIEAAFAPKGLDPAVLTPNMSCGIHQADLPVIVKMHGDCRFSDIRNLRAQTRRLSPSIRGAFSQSLEKQGLIVIGYAGRDDSVMTPIRDALKHNRSLQHGVYWIVLKGEEPPEQIQSLARKSNRLKIIECDGARRFFEHHWHHFSRLLPRRGDSLEESGNHAAVPRFAGEGGGLRRVNSVDLLGRRATLRLSEELDYPTHIASQVVGPFQDLSKAVGEKDAVKIIKEVQQDPTRLNLLAADGWPPELLEDLRRSVSEMREQIKALEEKERRYWKIPKPNFKTGRREQQNPK